jgi:hypothetical protein
VAAAGSCSKKRCPQENVILALLLQSCCLFAMLLIMCALHVYNNSNRNKKEGTFLVGALLLAYSYNVSRIIGLVRYYIAANQGSCRRNTQIAALYLNYVVHAEEVQKDAMTQLYECEQLHQG